MVLFGSLVMAALCVLPGGSGCAYGVIADALIITAQKLEIFASLEPVSKMVSMQIGVRRGTPNPNIIRRRVGVRCAHPNLQGYFEMASS
jgi:hypothetical protein